MPEKVNNTGKTKKRLLVVVLILSALAVAAAFLCEYKKSPQNQVNNKKSVKKTKPANQKTSLAVVKSPFNGKQKVTLKEIDREIQAYARKLENSKIKKAQFARFAKDFNIDETSDNFNKYLKAVILFESTRDAGLWHIKWDITNKEPNSDNIWAQWKSNPCSDLTKQPSAIAECDEISALYAFLMRKNGNEGTGLFWPTNNHTVAVWKVKSTDGKEVRVVVPTTQIFLQNEGLFGTQRFNPWKQKDIYDYTREDASLSTEVPVQLANFFMTQIYKYSGASEDTLQYIRSVRESIWIGINFRDDARREVKTVLDNYRKNNADPADINALEYFYNEFLKI